MKRAALVLAAAVALVAASSASGSWYVVPEDRQAIAAGDALQGIVETHASGPTTVDMGWCRPVKRSRWRCAITVREMQPDGTPVLECAASVLVSKHWWRYPPEQFGCPADWLPYDPLAPGGTWTEQTMPAPPYE